MILVDGNGILHPSRFGLACHIGVMADVPTVGVAKNLFQVSSILIGTVGLDNPQHITIFITVKTVYKVAICPRGNLLYMRIYLITDLKLL